MGNGINMRDRVLYYGYALLEKIGMAEVDRAAREIMDRLGIEFMVLKPEPVGLEWLPAMGYAEKALPLLEEFNEVLGELEVCCVVSPIGGHVLAWNKSLKGLGIKPAASFTDFTSFIYDWIMMLGIKPGFKEYRRKAYLHYPCCIGRKLETDTFTRKIKALLDMIPGLEIVETIHPEVVEGVKAPWEWSPCALTGLTTFFPELHSKALVEEMKPDLEELRPDLIVSPCARSVWSIRKAFEAEGVRGVDVIHTANLLLEVMG